MNMLLAVQKSFPKLKLESFFDHVIEYGFDLDPELLDSKLPNSVYLDSAQIQEPPEWTLRSQEVILKQLKRCGLYYNNQQNEEMSLKPKMQGRKILIWNRMSLKLDIMPATQLATVILHYSAAKDDEVYILQGGLEAYQKAKHDQELNFIVLKFSHQPQNSNQSMSQQHASKLQNIINQEEHHTSFQTVQEANNFNGKVNLEEKYLPKVIRDKKYVEEMLAKNSGQLVDVRSRDQWLGLTSGYSYCNRKGRIEGAIFHGIDGKGCASNQVPGYSLQSCASKEGFLDKWKAQGIDLNKEIVLYCGNGWRASLIMIYALLKGVTNISLYSDGWIEWSRELPTKSQSKEKKVEENCQSAQQQPYIHRQHRLCFNHRLSFNQKQQYP